MTVRSPMGHAAETTRGPDWESAAALLRVERVVVARPAPDGEWSISAGGLEPRDQLYRTLLRHSGPRSGILDTSLLGDPGLRMRAAGVLRLLVVPAPDGALVIGENPAGEAGPTPTPLALAGLFDAVLPAAPGPRLPGQDGPVLTPEDFEVVTRWMVTMAAQTVPDGPVSPGSARCLAQATRAEVAVMLIPDGASTPGGTQVRGSWSGPDGHFRGPVPLPWPLPDDQAALAESLDGLSSRPPVSPWQVVTARRGTLALAVTPPTGSEGALALIADFVAQELERYRTTREGRQRSLLEERMRIASLIHDGVTQQVSNVVIQLQLLELAAKDPARLAEVLTSAREATAGALEELRASLYELAPRLPDWDDLPTGLRAYADGYAAQWGIGVDVVVEGQSRPLDPETMMLAYSVVQECLTNVRKHAEADSVVVGVEFSDAELCLEVADDGAGFPDDPSTPAATGSRMGLRLLRDRLRHAGGHLEVRSRPGEGTTVAVRLPFYSLH